MICCNRSLTTCIGVALVFGLSVCETKGQTSDTGQISDIENWTNKDLRWSLFSPGYCLPLFDGDQLTRYSDSKSEKQLLEILGDENRFLIAHFALCAKRHWCPAWHAAINDGSTIRSNLGPIEVLVIHDGEYFGKQRFSIVDVKEQHRRVCDFWVARGGFWSREAINELSVRDHEVFSASFELASVVRRCKQLQNASYESVKSNSITPEMEDKLVFNSSFWGGLEFEADSTMVASVLTRVHAKHHGSLLDKNVSDRSFVRQHLILSQHLVPEAVAYRRNHQVVNGLTVTMSSDGPEFPNLQNERKSLALFWESLLSSKKIVH